MQLTKTQALEACLARFEAKLAQLQAFAPAQTDVRLVSDLQRVQPNLRTE